jgi:hypothetical protein
LASAEPGTNEDMHPRLWRLFIAVGLRLLLGAGVSAVGAGPLVFWLLVTVIVFVVPAPGRERTGDDDPVSRR